MDLPQVKSEISLRTLENELAAREHDGVAWWLAVNQHRTHRGIRLDFKRNTFQVDILKDQSRDQRYCKSVKCGVSELLIVKAMALIDQDLSAFWVLPDEPLRSRFVAERIDPVIQSVPRYQEYRDRARARTKGMRAPADARGLKQLAKGTITFVGSQSGNAMREAVADVLIVDEYDECDQGNLVKADDRLGWSEVRGKVRVGNPSIEGFGIDKLYKESDRKQWHIPCPHCNHRQPLDWFENVVRQTSDDEYELRDPGFAVLCRQCARPLERLAPGEWVAEYPGRDSSGYHISQLFSGTRTIKEMHTAFLAGLLNETEMQHFWNSIIGLGYHARGAKLFPDLLQRIVKAYPQWHNGTDCIIGADPGKEIHVVVLSPDGSKVVAILVLSGESKWTQLQNVLNAFEGYALVDCAYDTTKAREFQKANPGQVYLCDYRTSKSVDLYDLDDDLFVKVDRTQSMDESHAAILGKQIQLPRDAAGIPGFFTQMCAPTRIPVMTQSKFGGQKITFAWVEGSQADHWRHAFNYAWLLNNIRNEGGDVLFTTMSKSKHRRRRV